MRVMEETGRIVSWNRLAEKLTGYRSKDIIGKNYSQLYTKESSRRRELQKAIAHAVRHERYIGEGIRVHKDGTHIWVRCFITMMRTPERREKLFVIMMQDISERASKEQKREEYIGLVSHELRNPIATLSLYAELLAGGLQLDRDKTNLLTLREIQNQTSRLVTLVDDLLFVSRLKGSTLEMHTSVFGARALVRGVIKDFQRLSPTHAIEYHGGLELRVKADRIRISQVLVNILTNAVKYSPDAMKVIVRVTRAQKRCVVSVQDFGKGIAKKDQAGLFTRFFRTYDAKVSGVSGAGLGLYISKEIMNKHGEKLWLKSTPGKGATFFFTMALA
jgi:PAS domain S-box-containing protein